MPIVPAPALVSTAPIIEPPPHGMGRPPAYWGDPRIYELRSSYWWCTLCWKCADDNHVLSVKHRMKATYCSSFQSPDVGGDLPSGSGAGLTTSASANGASPAAASSPPPPPPPPPRPPPPQGPPATGATTDRFDRLSDSAAPGYWPNATTDTATGTPTSTEAWGPATYMRPNTAARQAGASASQTPRPQGTNDDGDTILGPWRACCRCGEPIGDSPDHEFSAFRGIRAEDANICSLGIAFDRCRHCGLPHHNRAVVAGLKECHDLPCTGHGWVATPRASLHIPECIRIPRIIETRVF